MIVIEKTEFDFFMEDEKFAGDLYLRWDNFCQYHFNAVVDNILSKNDNENSVISLDTLFLDLGTINEEDFYENFSQRLAEKLEEAISGIIKENDVKSYSTNVTLDWLKGLSESDKKTIQIEKEDISNDYIKDQHNKLSGIQIKELQQNLQINKYEQESILSLNYINNDKNKFDKKNQSIKNKLLNKEFEFSEKDLSNLLILFLEYRNNEISNFIKNNKNDIFKIISEKTIKIKSFISKLSVFVNIDPDLAEFLKKLFGKKIIKMIEIDKDNIHKNISAIDKLQKFLIENNKIARKRELIKYLLKNNVDILQKLWDITTEEQKIITVLNGNILLQILWVECLGNHYLHKICSDILKLQEYLSFKFDEKIIWRQLVKFTCKQYSSYSFSELYVDIIKEIFYQLNEDQKQEIINITDQKHNEFEQLTNSLTNLKHTTMKEKEKNEIGKYKRRDDIEPRDEKFITEINNAGLVLFSPWLPQLFSKLGVLIGDEKKFIDLEKQKKTAFLLQAILYDNNRKSYKENDMILNKLLAGLSKWEVLPDNIVLLKEELEIVTSMIKGVVQNCPKMKNTSIGGLREVFLKRKGLLEEKKDAWVLTVEQRSIDVLLDVLPWNYSIIKYEWMDKVLMVEWR